MSRDLDFICSDPRGYAEGEHGVVLGVQALVADLGGAPGQADS